VSLYTQAYTESQFLIPTGSASEKRDRRNTQGTQTFTHLRHKPIVLLHPFLERTINMLNALTLLVEHFIKVRAGITMLNFKKVTPEKYVRFS
jgi:hypothetical protein